MSDDYMMYLADAGTFAEDDPDMWNRELGEAWRTGFTSIDLDDDIDYDAALNEEEVTIYWTAWRVDHVSDPEGMAQGELDIAFAQGARAALKALGAVARPYEFIDDISVPAPDEDGERAKVAAADRIRELVRRLEADRRTGNQPQHTGGTRTAEGMRCPPARISG
jgi:hypothetical protein